MIHFRTGFTQKAMAFTARCNCGFTVTAMAVVLGEMIQDAMEGACKAVDAHIQRANAENPQPTNEG